MSYRLCSWTFAVALSPQHSTLPYRLLPSPLSLSPTLVDRPHRVGIQLHTSFLFWKVAQILCSVCTSTHQRSSRAFGQPSSLESTGSRLIYVEGRCRCATWGVQHVESVDTRIKGFQYGTQTYDDDAADSAPRVCKCHSYTCLMGP